MLQLICFTFACLQDGECGANLMRLEGPDGSLRHLEGEPGPVYNLFAFPAEDNFAGQAARAVAGQA
jgi:hypothetical protein